MRHQLTSISFPDGTTSTYRYDPLGRRIESNAAGVVTRDVYDGQNVRLRYDGSNTLTASFVDAGVDGHLEEIQAGQRLFYLQDGSNSTVQLTNTAGATVASYAYAVSGTPRRRTAPARRIRSPTPAGSSIQRAASTITGRATTPPTRAASSRKIRSGISTLTPTPRTTRSTSPIRPGRWRLNTRR